jgi:hypothetical protein
LLLLTSACSQYSFLSPEGRKLYRADVCGEFLSPESTTPNISGRGRSCQVKEDEEVEEEDVEY